MKKAYKKPMMLMESFGVTQMLSNCTLLIGFNNSACVLKDTDSTVPMRNMALAGYFTGDNCDWYPMNIDNDQGVCYHTSVNLAFTS